MQANKTTVVKQSNFLNMLQIYGLFGIAVAYPLFNFLQTNPAYLLTNGVSSEQLYLIVLMVTFFAPTVFVVLELELKRWFPKISRALHHSVVASLVALACCPLISRIEILPLPIGVILVLGFTYIVLREYRTSKFTYVGLAMLAPVTLILTIGFLRDHNISQLLSFDRSKEIDWQAEDNSRLSSIVLVVYDAFPMIDLLDAQGNIDQKRFPNFAQMANEATWYSNATTVHDLTLKAIPAILRGKLSSKGAVLPISESYPGTLFDSLHWDYRIHAFESATQLAGTYRGDTKTRSIDNNVLTTDLAIFYVRSLLPTPLADEWLPLEGDVWGGFFDRLPFIEKKNWIELRDWQHSKQAGETVTDRYPVSRQFIDEFADYPSNTFHFLHVLLPHRPYRYLPSGREYTYFVQKDTPDHETLTLDRGAHILQIGLADTLLGNLTSELKRLKRWDDAIVVIVADHGEAYRPGVLPRHATRNNFGEVGFIPLFIKYPNQKKGEIDDTNVQIIDIAPTVLDVLNIGFGPTMQGRSLIDPSAEIPDRKIMVSNDIRAALYFDEDEYGSLRSASHENAVNFFSLQDSRSDLYNYGPGLEYLGLKASTLAHKQVLCLVRSSLPGGASSYTLKPDEIQVLLNGTILYASGTEYSDAVVAIAVNGQIKAVTTPYVVGREIRFHKVLSDAYFDDGENTIEILVLSESISAQAAKRRKR